MSFFIGKTGLRHQWAQLTATAVNAATNQATSILWANLGRGGRFLYLDNTVNVDIALYLVHPDADSSDVTTRLFWIELPTNRVMNYDFLQQIQVSLDPGTKIFVSKAAGAGAASSGKINLSAFA